MIINNNMKHLFLIISLLYFLFNSCNTKNNFVNELIKEKEKEINLHYSFNKSADNMVRKKSKKLSNYFKYLLNGEEKYCDSIIDYCKIIDDKYSKKMFLEFKENISQHKEDIILLHYRILCETVERYNSWMYGVDGIQVHVDYAKRIRVGDTLIAKMYLTITNQYNQYSAIINNDTLNGWTPTYKKCIKKEGLYLTNGNIIFHNREKDIKLPFRINVDVEK